MHEGRHGGQHPGRLPAAGRGGTSRFFVDVCYSPAGWRAVQDDHVDVRLCWAAPPVAADLPFMLNLRVTGLDALIEHLEGAGVEVESRPDWQFDFGRFVRIRDPEGLPLELWEQLTD